MISCIMASRGHAFPARLAIDCYRRQTYADRELIVVSATPGCEVERLIARLGDPTIRFLAAAPGTPVGALRNQAIAAAAGDLVCVWDDDDLSHPLRLAWQAAALEDQGGEACVAGRVLLWWPGRRRLAVSARRTWENTLLARAATLPAYSDAPRGSDTEVIRTLLSRAAPAVVERADAYIYIAHDGNLWGADHFEMLFGHARQISPKGYDAVFAELDRLMPLGEYLRAGARAASCS